MTCVCFSWLGCSCFFFYSIYRTHKTCAIFLFTLLCVSKNRVFVFFGLLFAVDVVHSCLLQCNNMCVSSPENCAIQLNVPYCSMEMRVFCCILCSFDVIRFVGIEMENISHKTMNNFFACCERLF